MVTVQTKIVIACLKMNLNIKSLVEIGVLILLKWSDRRVKKNEEFSIRLRLQRLQTLETGQLLQPRLNQGNLIEGRILGGIGIKISAWDILSLRYLLGHVV